MRQAFIGVDVGTSSARAGVFDEKGTLLATARHPITVWHEAGNVVEQSSSEIWAACANSVRAAMAEAALPPSAVKGIGFDATCSLVVLDAAADPLTVSTSGDERRNVIVWMDHRATAEARLVNDTHDDVLRYVGGSISPEMEIPKLLWLKRHLPSSYHAAGHFFDLADYLSFRATGSTTRSICTLACKWNFLAHERRWSGSYFDRVGLGDLASGEYAKIGNEIVAPGTPLGAGLTKAAARDFGLLEATPVGASLIDAHAGGRGHDRRARQIGRAGRRVPPSCLHHGNLGLHHGDNERASLRAGRLGSLLFGDGSRILAQRRWPVRGRRGHRPSDKIPPCV